VCHVRSIGLSLIRRPRPRWAAILRLVTISAVILSLGLLGAGVSGCRPAVPPPSGGVTDPGPSGPVQPPLAGGEGLILTERPLSLGKVEVKEPAADTLLEIPGIGSAPPDQVWVYLAEGFGAEDASAVASALGGSIVGEVEFISAYQVQTSATSIEALLDAVAAAEAMVQVEFALPNLLLDAETHLVEAEMCNPTTNEYYSAGHTRPYEMIGLRDAWAMVLSSGVRLSPVHVGVLDRPVWVASYEANQAGGPRLLGLSVADMESIADAALASHGTQVAHVIAADHRISGAIGVASVLGGTLTVSAANIYSALELDLVGGAAAPPDDTRVLEHGGARYLVYTLTRLAEMVEAGATIINCSFGTRAPTPDTSQASLRLREATHAAYRRFLERLALTNPQVLVVASGGNDNVSINEHNREFAQRLDNVMTIAALDNNGNKAAFSNYMAEGNLELSLAAPGVGIVTAVGNNGSVRTPNGTSVSAPMVAGAAAILRSLKPDLTAAQIKQILTETGSPRVPSVGGESFVSVPANVGGRILRVDSAVLNVVNLIRRQAGALPVTREELLGLYDIAATVSGGPGTYTVTASVDEVRQGGDELTLTVSSGRITVAGQGKQPIPANGQVTWQIERAGGYQGSAQLELRREPVGSCATIAMYDQSVVEQLHKSREIAFSAEGFGGALWQSSSGGLMQQKDSDGFGILAAGTPPRGVPIGGFEEHESRIDWSGTSFEAYEYRKHSGTGYTEERGLRGQLSPDGTRLLWAEIEVESFVGTMGGWVYRVRVVDLPLQENTDSIVDRPFVTHDYSAQRNLAGYYSCSYRPGPQGGPRWVAGQESTSVALSSVIITFRTPR